MTHIPTFAVLSFDYRESESWPDLPRLRGGLERLVATWSTHLRHELDDIVMTTEVGGAMAALEDLLNKRLTAQDAMLIYIGGHGARLGDDYFVAGPAATPERLTVRNGVAASDVAQLIGQGTPSQVTLLIDTCFSGAGSARLASSVDDIIGRQAKDGFSMFLMSSAHALDLAWDGVFVDELLDLLSDPEPLLWAKTDRYIAPSQVARALRDRLGSAIESREHNYVEPILPNLAFRDWISAVDESARLAREHFLRAASGSSGDGPWCFIDRDVALEAISDWVTEEESGMFVLTGPPGGGKSAILGLIAVSLDEEGRREVSRRGGRPWHPPEFADLQQAVAVHARERALSALVAEIAHGLGAIAPRTPDDLLAHLASSGSPVFILVDALDEADADDAGRMATFLRDAADIPNVRVIVGTRPDRARREAGARLGPLLRALEPARICDLRDHPYMARADVARYVAARLRGERLQADDAETRALVANIASDVAGRTDGVFLYARLMVEVLLARTDLDATNWRSILPNVGGANLLRAVVDQDLRRVPRERRSVVRHMLMALSFAEGEGLPRYQVWPAVATGLTGKHYDEADAGATVRWASWYLAESAEAGQPVYRLNHEELIRHFQAEARHEF